MEMKPVYASDNDFATLFLGVQKDYFIVAADMLAVPRSTRVQEYLTVPSLFVTASGRIR